MKNQLRKLNRQRGFTIIEVMIVLAIAGLILLIVFLAVPALQRSARNTSRKNDVSAIGSAFANFEGNNNGVQPTAVGYDVPDSGLLYVYCNGASSAGFGATAFHVGQLSAASTGCTNANTNFETAKLGYYQPGNNLIFFNATAVAPTLVAPGGGKEDTTHLSTNSVIIDLGFSCNSTNTGLGNATNKAVAIEYDTETSTGFGNLQCLQE